MSSLGFYAFFAAYALQALGYSDAVGISVDRETVAMGESVTVTAGAILGSWAGEDESVAGWLLVPYMNGARWGAHAWTDASGRAVFHIPLPNVGPQEIQVLAWRPNSFTLTPAEAEEIQQLLPEDVPWNDIDEHIKRLKEAPEDADRLTEMQARAQAVEQKLNDIAQRHRERADSLPVFERWAAHLERNQMIAGAPMPNVPAKSNTVQVQVTRREITRKDNGDSLIGMQWEPWFTPRNAYWGTAQAVPVMGYYSSFNRDVQRQHLLWFMDLGVDFILADWSNHLWDKQHWNERGDATAEIIHATELMLETMAVMRDEGLPVPSMVLMPGLSNGPPTTIQALDEMLEWAHHHYLRNPRFKDLWQEFDGNPLVVILDTATLAAAPDAAPISEAHWTVRWMSHQLQITQHHEKGYWSWMDGSLHPIITERDGKAEAITVTPAYFGHGGWKYPQARGRRNGSTYLESFKPAFEARPRVILLHQWNEYAGQREGRGYGEDKDIYVDSYSVELSDELEPVSMSTPGYRGDAGGWGYYYANLTQALLAMYRGAYPEDTLLAIASPLDGAIVEADSLEVKWTWIGRAPEAFSVRLEGKELARVTEGTTATLDLSVLPAGPHRLSVMAEGAQSHFPLQWERMDTPLEAPGPVEAELHFVKH